MNRYYKIFNIFRYIAYILMGLEILALVLESPSVYLIFLGIFVLIILNNFLRERGYFKGADQQESSLFVYLLLSLLLIWFLGFSFIILIYLILAELVLYYRSSFTRFLAGLSFFILVYFNMGRLPSLENLLNLQYLMTLVFVLVYNSLYFLYFLTLRRLFDEKSRAEDMNKRLKASLEVQEEQALQLEELTLEKERNRMAGEIHDSLGHNLVALGMNLDVAEKILESDSKRALGLIKKSRELTSKSMEELRGIVYALKKEELDLRKNLEDMIENLQSTGLVEIDLDIKGDLKKLSGDEKEQVYKSTKELLTNSLRHGQAKRIDVSLDIDESLILRVRDYGLGCQELVKGSGLKALEERLKALGGSIFYSYEEGEGFKTELFYLLDSGLVFKNELEASCSKSNISYYRNIAIKIGG